MTRDAEASAKFYTALFGWTREDMDTGGSTYAMFKTKGRPVGGMVVLPPEAESMPVMWMGYVTVENLEASIAKAVNSARKSTKGSRQSRWAASPSSPILMARSLASGSLLPELESENSSKSLFDAVGATSRRHGEGCPRYSLCLSTSWESRRRSSNWLSRSVRSCASAVRQNHLERLNNFRRLEKSICIRRQFRLGIFFSDADGLITQPKG